MLTFLRNKLPWLLLLALSLFLGYFFLRVAGIQQGGDIVEYHGLTQTIIHSQTLHLTPQEQASLEQVLHKAYFENPHYYVTGRDGNRYPVHFFVYSLLAVPIRLILRVFGENELKSLWMTNVFTYIMVMFALWKTTVKESWARIVVLALTFFSPLMFFFIWPGPDLWYLMVLLAATFAAFNRKLLLASFLTAIASWHSQPLIVLAALFAGLSLVQTSNWQISKTMQTVKINLRSITLAIGVGLLGLIPYGYNLYAFGQLTPWTNLQDGWTQINGFGVHNASLWKLFEQIFDLNIGQFWYAPVLFLIALGYLIYKAFRREWLYPIITGLFIITAFFYQTNPGWHYGTSGFGPGRHGLLFLPLIIVLTFQALKKFSIKTAVALVFIISSQLFLLSTNNFLEPDLTRTLHHSVFATYALENYPEYYNPTPEIFQDRTNHDDVTYPTTAIYKNESSECVKAYVLFSDVEKVEQECGSIPNKDQIFDNEFLRVANYPRQVVTTEATFWPEPDACAEWFTPTTEKPFVCPNTLGSFMKETGISNPDLLSQVPEFPYPGIWKLESEQPILVTVPAGYIIHHRSFDGAYVHF